MLSPCITYRPEQRDWKKKVQRDALTPTGDAAEAAMQVLRNDPLALGVLYRGQRAAYEPHAAGEARPVAELEARFVV